MTSTATAASESSSSTCKWRHELKVPGASLAGSRLPPQQTREGGQEECTKLSAAHTLGAELSAATAAIREGVHEAASSSASSSLSSSQENGGEAAEPQPVALAAIGKKTPVAIHTCSSQFASALSTIVFYPFDVLKTRFMSQDGTVWRQHNGRTYSSIPRSLAAIFREEGVRTMFRGCTVAVCGSITAWGLYMFFYRELCNITEASSFLGRSGLSISASLASSLLSSPIFLIKSRMQLEESTKSSHYCTFWRALRHTIAMGGVRSLWRGVSLQLLLVFPNALGLPMYDCLKAMLLSYRWQHHEQQRDMNILEVCLCSTATKVVLLTLSHPLVMMKVRLQDQRSRQGAVQYRSVGQTLLTIVRTQGLRGLYRGYSTAMVHSLPRSLMHYVLYEKSLNALCRHWDYQR